MKFDSINWDDFWRRRYKASHKKKLRTSLDEFEIIRTGHRTHAEQVIEHLQRSFKHVHFAASNFSGGWQIFARTLTRSEGLLIYCSLSESEKHEVVDAAEAILANVESEYPLDTLPTEKKLTQQQNTCKSDHKNVPTHKLMSLIPTKNRAAMIGYYLGIFSLIVFPLELVLSLRTNIETDLHYLGLALSIAVITCGVLGIVKANAEPESKGKVHAITALVLGIITFLFYGFLAFVIAIFSGGPDAL